MLPWISDRKRAPLAESPSDQVRWPGGVTRRPDLALLAFELRHHVAQGSQVRLMGRQVGLPQGRHGYVVAVIEDLMPSCQYFHIVLGGEFKQAFVERNQGRVVPSRQHQEKHVVRRPLSSGSHGERLAV
jgi:hypothetical protein